MCFVICDLLTGDLCRLPDTLFMAAFVGTTDGRGGTPVGIVLESGAVGAVCADTVVGVGLDPGDQGFDLWAGPSLAPLPCPVMQVTVHAEHDDQVSWRLTVPNGTTVAQGGASPGPAAVRLCLALGTRVTFVIVSRLGSGVGVGGSYEVLLNDAVAVAGGKFTFRASATFVYSHPLVVPAGSAVLFTGVLTQRVAAQGGMTTAVRVAAFFPFGGPDPVAHCIIKAPAVRARTL